MRNQKQNAIVIAKENESVQVNVNVNAAKRAAERKAQSEARAAERAILRGAVTYKERVNVARENYAALKYSRIFNGFLSAQPSIFQTACKHVDFHAFCEYIDARYKNGVKTYAEISNFYVSQFFQKHIKDAAQDAAHKDYSAARNYLVAERVALQNAKNA